MREDRLLRRHQRPWLHPAAYAPYADRFTAVADALSARASAHGFVECVLTFGGDVGFHTECRLVRRRAGDWFYELDCHEAPFQSLPVATEEMSAVYDHIRELHAVYRPGSKGMTYGPDAGAPLSVLWYHATPDRLVWLRHFEPLQEALLDLLKGLHGRLEVPFPKL